VTEPANTPIAGPPCVRCQGDLVDHLLVEQGPGDQPQYECLTELAQDVLHDMRTARPAADRQWVDVVEGLAQAHARSLTNVAGPVLVTRATHLADVRASAAADVAEGASGMEVYGLLAILRDIADNEPLAALMATGAAFGAHLAHYCTTCGAQADDTADGVAAPFPHLISCPWARAVQIVGLPIPEGNGRG